MGNLSNLYISQSFQSLAHLGTNNALVPGTMTQLEDGIGQSLNISFDGTNISSSGNIYGANITASVINTGSFATTGSNTFTGQQTIQNSLVIENPSNQLEYTQLAQNNANGLFQFYQSAGNGYQFNNNVQINGDLTASLQEGYIWVGDSAGRTVTVSTSSFGGGSTDITALNAFTASQLTINAGYNTTTASLNSSVSQLNANTSSQQLQIDALIAATGSYSTSSVNLTSLNEYTASNDQKWNNLGAQSGSFVTESETGSFLITSSFNQYTASQQSFNASATASIVELQQFSSSLDANFVTEAELSAATASLITQINTKLDTASFNSYTQSNDQRVNSLEVNSASVNISITNLNSTTASQATSISNLNQFSQSAQISINSLNGATSSYANSASVALVDANQQSQIDSLIAVTASFLTSSADITSLNQFTASQETKNTTLASVTQSLNQFTQSQSNLNSTFATTGSNTFNGDQIINGNISAVSGTFQYIHTVFETASVIYSSGSNQFGDELTDIQTLSGSVRVQGSLTVNGTAVLTSSADITSLNQFTQSQETKNATLGIYTASVDISLNNLNANTASQQAQIDSLISVTGSYAISASVAAVDAAQQSQINQLIAVTSSFLTSSADITSLNEFTASQLLINIGYNTFTQSAQAEIDSLQAATASYAISSSVAAVDAGQQLQIDALIAATGSYITTPLTSLNEFTSSQLSINSGYNSFTASQLNINSGYNSYTASNDEKWNNLGSQSGSFVTESETGSFVTTSSFNAYTQSADNRLTNIESFTSSANTQLNNLASSQSIDNQKWDNLGAQSGSFVTESETGSFARYDVSNPWSANQTFTNITAVSASFQYVQTTYETSSVIYSSGSNQFGDELSDIQTLSGSVKVQGSLTVNGTPVQTSSVDITSLNAFTASQETKDLTLASVTSSLNSATASLFTSASNALVTASVSGQLLTFNKGNNSQFTLTLPTGSGTYVTGSFGSFHDETTQSGSANTPNIVKFSNTDLSQDVFLSGSSALKVGSAGVYNLQFSLQVKRVSGSGTDTIDIWFRKNGSDIDWSNTTIGLDGGVEATRVVPAWNFMESMEIGDYLEILWQSTDDNIQLISVPASGSLPSIPSVIATMQRVDVGGGSNMVTTSSFNAYTSSNDQKVNSLINATGSYATTGSNTFRGAQTINLSGTAQIFASSIVGNATRVETDMYVDGGNYDTFNILLSASAGLQLRDYDFTNDVPLPFISVGTDAGELTLHRNTNISGNLDIQSTLTASLQEGYVWAGGAGNVSKLVATSSFIDTINTGSFATTGSNNFVGTQYISSSNGIAIVTTGSIKVAAGSLITSSRVDVENTIEMGDGSYFRFLSGSSYYNMQLNPTTGAWSFSRSGVSNTKTLQLAGYEGANTTFESNPVVFADTTTQVTFNTPARFNNGINNNLQITGSLTVFGSNTFIGSQTITGSLVQSGSNTIASGPLGALVGNIFNSRVLISGGTTGTTTPILYISGSDGAYTQLSRNLNLITTVKRSGVFDSSGQFYANTSSVAGQYIGVYDDPNFNTDVELAFRVTKDGSSFSDWDNGSVFDYIPFMTLEPNLGDNPPPQFKRSIAVTGSVSITEVMNLKAQNPLPTGNIGDLAVSGSHLYFYNGAWTQLD